MKKPAAIIALVHLIITFFTDPLVFEALKDRAWTALESEKLVNYLACKACLLVLLFLIWNTLLTLGRDLAVSIKQKKLMGEGVSEAYKVAGYALIYLIPIIAVMIFKLPEGFLSNDERLIFQEASQLNNYTWFYYLTTWYYIICMMLIPAWVGPILVKVAIQVITCGYCVYRARGCVNKKRAYLVYLPFFLFPVLAYTTSAHRIPVYYLIYLLFAVKLAADRYENKAPDTPEIAVLFFASALITQWRTEGIYMAPLGVILVMLAYPGHVTSDGKPVWKRILGLIAMALLIQYAVQVPQNGFIPTRMDDKAQNRMGPFWAYTITNMYRNGLDLEKNAADMEKVYRFLDKDVLRSINEDLGDINYEDTLILYYPGYTGVIEGGDYETYVEGCTNIFKNNPDVFLRTRWGAFKYAALPYYIGTDADGIVGLIKLGFSVFKSLSYNLFIPCVLVVIFWAVTLIRKKWLYFFLMSGLICHWFIVYILAPASYFKYYLPVYMIAYFALIARLAGEHDTGKQAG